MNALTSTEFRKTYAKLKDLTEVTVNGHVIGVWTPADYSLEFQAFLTGERPARQSMRVPAHMDPTVRTSQAKRDELLGKINRSK